MRRGFVVALMVLLVAGFGAPERAVAQGVIHGVRGGVTASSLIGLEENSFGAGFHAGFVGGYFFTRSVGVTLEVNYSQQGTKCSPNAQGVAFDYHYDYLNLPLEFNYRLPINNVDLRLRAGVQLGIFLNATYDYTAPSILQEGYVEGCGTFQSSAFHPYDVGATLGAVWQPWEFLALDVRYAMGITQTHDGISNTFNGHYYISVPDNRNSVWQFGLSLLF